MARARRARRSSGYQRGEDSRQRLIEAGLEIFGRYGFEGASTRMLAETANANLAAIPYYFDSKEGLYRAVAEHVAAQIGDWQAPVVERIGRALKAGPSKDQALSLLNELLDSLAEMIVASEDADRWASFIMREQMDPTPAFDILYGGVMKRLLDACAALIGRLLDRPQDDPDTLIRTFTIVGQILIFRTARAAAMRRLGWTSFSEGRLKRIRAVVRHQVKASLFDAPGAGR